MNDLMKHDSYIPAILTETQDSKFILEPNYQHDRGPKENSTKMDQWLLALSNMDHVITDHLSLPTVILVCYWARDTTNR